MQYVLWITFTVSDVMTNYIDDNCLNFFLGFVCVVTDINMSGR